jgi:hypothetical protein
MIGNGFNNGQPTKVMDLQSIFGGKLYDVGYIARLETFATYLQAAQEMIDQADAEEDKTMKIDGYRGAFTTCVSVQHNSSSDVRILSARDGARFFLFLPSITL